MKLGFIVVFVPDVEAAIAFYERAFDGKRKIVTRAFGTLETGATTLAFGSEENERHELGDAVAFRPNRRDVDPAGAQISFIAADVHAAYRKAVAAGALPVIAPAEMPWGQIVSRVRDLNGVLVSIVSEPKF
jgi:uncharacterized glyoxalase superfamily protein PhnB